MGLLWSWIFPWAGTPALAPVRVRTTPAREAEAASDPLATRSPERNDLGAPQIPPFTAWNDPGRRFR